jgi:hypothetical protein
MNSSNNVLENNKEKNVDFNPKEANTHFNAFNSALFMSEFQGNEENISEKTNKDNKKDIMNTNQDLKFSDSYEKCLTDELLDKIINDSNDTKKDGNIDEQVNFELDKNIKDEKMINSEKILKISKNLFNQSDMLTKEKNVKKKNCIYEENNNGFEYQLKFIENSVQNILPKSYKKSSYNSINNSYYYNNNNNIYQNNINANQRISTFNKFNICDNYDNSSSYQNENNYNYINNFCVSPFESNYDDNNYSLIYDNQKIKYQVHKLKVCNSNSYGWKCNKCYYLNKGYRKSCVNCKNNRKANF